MGLFFHCGALVHFGNFRKAKAMHIEVAFIDPFYGIQGKFSVGTTDYTDEESPQI